MRNGIDIHAPSYVALSLHALLSAILLIVAYYGGVSWWLLLILFGLIAGIFWHLWQQASSWHLTPPAMGEQGDALWQLVPNPVPADGALERNALNAIGVRQATEVYEAVLAEAADYGQCVILRFWVHYPDTQWLTIWVWRDQVALADWRKIKVAGRFV